MGEGLAALCLCTAVKLPPLADVNTSRLASSPSLFSFSGTERFLGTCPTDSSEPAEKRVQKDL